MDNYRKVYERIVTHLLSRHAEQGIPADADLWPVIEQRLARRVQPAEHPTASGRPTPLEPGTPPAARPASGRPPRPATRLRSSLGAAVAMLGLVILAGISWLAISRLAQQQEKPGVGTPTAVSTMTAVSTAQVQPAEDSTFLFSISVGEGGIEPGDKYLSGFFAALPDGTFWAGSGDARLLRYSAEGVLLGTIDIPSNEGYPSDMVTDGTDIWLQYRPEPGRTGPMTLYRVSPDGGKLAEYTIEFAIGTNFSGLMLGENGEVLLKGRFYGVTLAAPATLTAVAPVVPIVPNPVPSVIPEVYPKPLLQLIDSQGNLAPKGLDGYSYGGKLYSARASPASGVLVKAGDVEFTIPLAHTIFSVGILGVEPDGSFYVDVAEEEDVGTTIAVYRTIFHYAADGRLIQRARIPDMYNKLFSGPDGRFYVLRENPLSTQRGGAPPSSVDVYRLNFYPADQPLPPTPTAMPTVPTWTPAPTAPPEPPLDLDALIAKSDVIAHVRLTGYDQQGPDADVVLHLQVEEWLKPSQGTGTEPQGTGANTIHLYMPAKFWAAMPEAFRTLAAPMYMSPFVMFLTKPRQAVPASSPDAGETYELTGGPESAFSIYGDHVQGVVRGQYDGMILYDFKRVIRGEPTATPVIPAVPAEATSTRLPNSPPVALSREGDGFRLDVYEGVARLGVTPWSGPWIGPSKLLVHWSSVPSDPGATPGVYSGATYILDTESGTLAPLASHESGRDVFPSPDGSRAVMVWQNSNLRVAVYDFRSGDLQMVADLDPSIPQWTGPEIGIDDFRPGTEVFAYVTPKWAGNDSFALTLTRGSEAVTQGHDRALLVDIPQQQVRVLAERGIVLAAFPDGSVLVRSGRIDGEIQLFRPGEQFPTTIAPSGPWRVSSSVSPDGKRVAWVEMDPPPGDWSKRLPDNCCSGDPAPILRNIAVWDSTTGEVRRFNVADFAWSIPDISWSQFDKLVWSKDSSSLFYSTHPAQDRTTLYRLSMDGRTDTLVEMDKPVGFTVVAEGNDGSIYFMMNGKECQNCSQLVRGYPDGRQEAMYQNAASREWQVDKYERLEVLKDGGVAVTDLTTGQFRQVNFPGVIIIADELEYSTLGMLVPLSPDGRWAAYTKTFNYSGGLGPDGRPDYGRTVHIVRVK